MNPYEPITMPRYEVETLKKRCAELEDIHASLQASCGLTAEQLIKLFLCGYNLCPPGGPSIQKSVEANTIKDLIERYPLTIQHIAVIGNFCAQTAMTSGQLSDFLWRQLFLWQIGFHGPDILERV